MHRLPEARPDLAVSLSSAFLGFHSHAGFLQGLVEGGLWPAQVAGASSGALVAALAASGMHPREIFDLLQSRRFRWSFFEWGMFIGAPFFPLHRRRHSGCLQGRAILGYLKGVLGDRRIEDCRTRLGIAVTNLSAVRAEIRTTGPLAEVVVASCAFPGAISHQILNDEALWDGGIAQNSPFSHWTEEPQVKRVLVHDVGAVDTPQSREIGLFSAMARAHDVVGAELHALRLEKLTNAGKTLERFRTLSAMPGLVISRKIGLESFELGRMSGFRAAHSCHPATDGPAA
jgi:predicted acylesterase/phospholipase RssA